MRKRIFALGVLCLSLMKAYSQEMTIDTTDAMYQVGLKVGSWIPVIIILTILLFYIRHTYRFGKEEKGKLD